MNRRLGAAAVLLVITGLATTCFVIVPKLFPPRGNRIVCPGDSSAYVWTPVGTRSENFL